MESNSNNSEVNDSEVPLKTDHNQSDNGLETIRSEKDSLNSELESSDDQKMASNECETKESEEVVDTKADKSSDGSSRFKYSKEQLIQISKLSSARIRPKCLDNAFNNTNNNLWNPEKWISSRSPAANASNKYNKKDPKERVVEEESDIILSPQRGSFGTGCHVSSNSFPTNRASNDSRSRDHYSERNKMEESMDGSHRSNINSRRVGSGRIVQKERDRLNDWSDRNFDRTYDREREVRDNRDNRNDDYNDRRSGRYERRPNREMNSNRNSRYESHRYREHKYSRDEEENEPEWFTEGPTSKHDTIELRGFDDDPNSLHVRDSDKPNDDRNEDLESNVVNKMEPNGKEGGDTGDLKTSDDFDVNAMFKSEEWFGKEYETPDNKMISSSAGISENVNSDNDMNSKSRFKRWFKESPNQAMTQMSSESIDFSQSTQMSQKNSQRDSAAMPSMGRHSNTQTSNPISPQKIFELLSNGSNRMSIEQISHQKFDPRKAMSLDEIEANFNKREVNNGEGIEDNKRAFDKLIIDLNKKSVQSSNFADRTQNEAKNETTLIQTPDSHVIIPNSMRNAPSILELLKEQENKEAMADLHLSGRRVGHQVTNYPNGSNISQNSINNIMFGSHSLTNASLNPMEGQNWQNSSSLQKIASHRSPPNHEMSDQTSLLQKTLHSRQQQQQQQMGQMVRPQSQTNTPNRSVFNSFTPTSVMRNMKGIPNADKERDSRSEMTPESNSSQFKFLNENFISKPSPMRPIVKSNNPIVQSVAPKQSPLPPHSDSMTFSANTMAAIQSHLYIPQQNVQQSQTPVNSYQRPNNASNANVRPFAGLGQSSLTRNSTPSPSALNNIGMNSNQQILQMFNNPNVRTNVNQMQLNQMMALQHSSASDVRQSQYSQSRPITATNVQQMLFNTSKSDNYHSYERNMMSESSDIMKTSVPTTYSQPRPQMQQMFQSSGPSHPNRNTESRFLGQIFGEDALHHNLPELPTVPLHSALTLDDIERS